MIYLIKSAAVEDDKFFYVLKIGYTRDDHEASRFGSYKNHNPTYKVLYKIPGGTREQEDQIHALFMKFRKFNIEWYSYEEEILNYFKEHRTKEDLDADLFKDLLKTDREDLPKKYRQRIVSDKVKLKAKIDAYIEKNECEDRLIEFFEKFLSFEDFLSRMKLVCSDLELFKDKYGILSVLGSDFLKYYKTLGPKKIKALKYCRESLKKECERLANNSSIDISGLIYENFKVGERYLNTEAKSKLAEIFEANGFNETPKAIILERYFNTKTYQATNKETGKRDNGIILLSKKGD